MPYSSTAFDRTMNTLLAILKPASACDIGPGAGKYGQMIRMSNREQQYTTKTTAVEISAHYVAEFQLHNHYDEIIVADADTLIDQPRLRFDFVIIGDCIEHMRKSKGIDLIDFLVYRAGYIAIIYPDKYVQDDWEGHAQEAHISVWGEADFANFECKHTFAEGMHLFLIKGYQPTARVIETLNQETIAFRDIQYFATEAKAS